jgi:hypothetical protein
VGDRSRGRFATPADLPLQYCSPYSHVRLHRGSLGFVHRPRSIFCRPVPKTLALRFATFASLYGAAAGAARQHPRVLPHSPECVRDHPARGSLSRARCSRTTPAGPPLPLRIALPVSSRTVVQKLRIVTLRFGTGREIMALERWTVSRAGRFLVLTVNPPRLHRR